MHCVKLPMRCRQSNSNSDRRAGCQAQSLTELDSLIDDRIEDAASCDDVKDKPKDLSSHKLQDEKDEKDEKGEKGEKDKKGEKDEETEEEHTADQHSGHSEHDSDHK